MFINIESQAAHRTEDGEVANELHHEIPLPATPTHRHICENKQATQASRKRKNSKTKDRSLFLGNLVFGRRIAKILKLYDNS